MFEITWHKIWCIMNESQKRKLIIHGNNPLVIELYNKLSLVNIQVDAIISDEQWMIQNYKRIQIEDIKKNEHYVIFTEMVNEKPLIDKMEQLGFEMFYHYRFLKDFYLPSYYKFLDLSNSSTTFSAVTDFNKIPEKSRIGMYVLSHKECNIPQGDLYQGMQVGSANKKKIFLLQDINGENISNKNNQFCELTGIYWLWKNLNTDYIGICHYRRYFYDDSGEVLREPMIRELLNNYDMIVPYPMKFKSKNIKYLPEDLDILTHYQQEHYITDLLNTEKYLRRNNSEYCVDFWKTMAKKTCYGYNMFVTSKKIFDSYCEWLFPILFDLESSREMVWEDNYQKRVYGFLSERLFNVWILHHRIKCKELLVIQKEY